MYCNYLGVAKTLLRACDGDLEVALNTHLNMEESISELNQKQSPGERPNSQSGGTEGLFIAKENEGCSSSSSVKDDETGINESILSLLVKLKNSFQGSPDRPARYGT